MIGTLVNSPKTDHEFADNLKHESWCASYAFRIRWPHGFVCPTCGAAHPESGFQQRPICRACGRSSSITAGTLLHGSKKSLGTWFRALWWLSGERSSISVTKLRSYLGFRSYQTGWAWLGKLRIIIQVTNRKQCHGIVLVDSVPITLSGNGAQLLTAVESVARGRATGRLQMKLCDSLSREVVTRFCNQAVMPGSIIIVPGRAPFTSVGMVDTIYTVEDSSLHHEEILRISASYRLWRRRNKSWSPRHYSQSLADEFCFFHNGTLCTSRVHLFETLVVAALSQSPGDFDLFRETEALPGGLR